MPLAMIDNHNAVMAGDKIIINPNAEQVQGCYDPKKPTAVDVIDRNMENKITFMYGTMNCGKSAEILRLVHEYHEQGKNILTIKPLMSARKSKTDIVTRSGESYPADVIEKKDNWDGQFTAKVAGQIKDLTHLDMVVADEAQFLEPKHVIQLYEIVHKHFPGTPIMLFGLLKDYQNHLFPTSKFLVEYVDDLRELKAVCWFCNQKATRNLRISNGHPVYEGNEIEIGGNDHYKSVCRHHFYYPNLGGFNHES